MSGTSVVMQRSHMEVGRNRNEDRRNLSFFVPIPAIFMSSDSTSSFQPYQRQIVVAVGASAGGLVPLQEFFSLMPVDTGMSFVVVQHLSPDFDSVMNELLAKHTDMPIMIIEEGMTPHPNTIYLNPPSHDVQLINRVFTLSRFDPNELRMPINAMFHSVATCYGVDAVGVVLSGTGSDGATGLQAIHEAAGLTIVQSLDTAQFDGMPRNAIATRSVDHVLSPSAMVQLLAGHAVEPLLKENSEASLDVEDLTGVRLIFSLLESAYGINFSQYKPTTVARRIDRRCKLSRFGSLQDYAKLLKGDEAELDLLYHDLLIGVTKFFRDPEAYEVLRQELALMIQQIPADRDLRVWSVGCASGEEPYSLAMMLTNLYRSQGREPNFKVFATDVHDRILETASKGVYVESEIAGLSPELKEQFFFASGEGRLQVNPQLRNRIVFAKQNVIYDPPFTRIDLVTCRNLLIYLQDEAQSFAISGFRYAMRDEGLMMLGPSETVGKLASGFDVVDKGWRLFRKNKQTMASPMRNGRTSSSSAGEVFASTLSLVEVESQTARLSAVSHKLLSDYLPAALLLDPSRNILHVFGKCSKYLQSQEGSFSGSVLNFFEGDARSAIAGLFLQARNAPGSEFRAANLRLPVGPSSSARQYHQVDVTAKAFSNSTGSMSVVLLKFIAISAGADDRESETDPGPIAVDERASIVELLSARESLGATITELENSNQELQAANEEMIASNEELQATNEELQSVNEELHTVNVEHQRKVQELEEITDDFNNLINSTEVGSIMLDDQLRIRKFNEGAQEYFQLMDHDVGRPLTNFAAKVSLDDLHGKVEAVLQSGEEFTAYSKERDGRLLSIQISPYYASQKVSGVILNLTDLTKAFESVSNGVESTRQN